VAKDRPRVKREGRLFFEKESGSAPRREPRKSRKVVVAAAAVIVLIVVSFAGYQFYLGSVASTSSLPNPASATQSTSQTAMSESTSTQTTTSSLSSVVSVQTFPPFEPANPNFSGGKANVSEPADYSVLVQFALGLINRDRTQSGVSNVTLSSGDSGQQHADSLDYFGTFGHWDVQGYKPYMRYTLLGGTGNVAENVGEDYCTNSPPSAALVQLAKCDLQTIENGIANSESGLMNRDATCCNNGHRENILNAFHTSVSIGIAYNSTTKAEYLVEDFEDNYIASESLQLSGSTVTFQGSTQQDLTGWTGKSSGAQIGVYYDPTPAVIDASELAFSAACSQYSELDEPASCQYQGAYGLGTMVTQVFAPCPQGYTCGSGQLTYAQQWTYSTSGSFMIVFSIASLEAAHGPGVYTLCFYPNGDTTKPITSLSLFVTGT